MIELDGLTKRYDGVVVVDQLSLVIPRGQLLVLLGGSGSGKTTTLKMINRLIEPTAGAIRIVTKVQVHEALAKLLADSGTSVRVWVQTGHSGPGHRDRGTDS